VKDYRLVEDTVVQTEIAVLYLQDKLNELGRRNFDLLRVRERFEIRDRYSRRRAKPTDRHPSIDNCL